MTPGELPPLAPRVTWNVETLMKNLELNLLAEDTKKSCWIQIFSPRAAFQATWVTLGSELYATAQQDAVGGNK